MRLLIRDSGIGFDPSRTEALFSPFTQADGSVTRAFGGTGLGLAITRSLVQLMRGQVTARSLPGQGASFEVSLPLRPVRPGELAPQTQAEPAGLDEPCAGGSKSHPLSILQVEDHAINRKLAEVLLQRMGHRTVTASDGQQALDRLAQQDFDLVLMDVMMPVLDGISAVRRLREREAQAGRHTPVLMVTAHAMTGDRERFVSEGADGYVSKPLSVQALCQEIARVLPERTGPHA